MGLCEGGDGCRPTNARTPQVVQAMSSVGRGRTDRNPFCAQTVAPYTIITRSHYDLYSRLRYFRQRIPIRRPLGERLTRLTGVPAEPPIVKVREELLVVASPDPVVGFVPR